MSFRQVSKTYKNTYVRWVCSGRNTHGTEACPNRTKIDENQLKEEIKNYFMGIVENDSNIVRDITNKFIKKHNELDDKAMNKKNLEAKIEKLNKNKKKYMEMFENDIITIQELKEKTKLIIEELNKLSEDLKLIKLNIGKADIFKNNFEETLKDIKKIVTTENLTHNLLCRVIEKITVDANGKIEVYLKLLDEIGLDNFVLLFDDCTYSCKIIDRFLLTIA